MKELEKIKKQGAIEALKKYITSMQFNIEHAFDGGIYEKGYFAINGKLAGIDTCVNNIREAMKALNEIDPGHN